jgi:hypothetical protein
MSESELGATPVPALRIVPERKQSDRNRWHLKETQRENFKLYKRFLFFYFLFFKKKKKSWEVKWAIDLIVLSVLIRIQWGIGLF